VILDVRHPTPATRQKYLARGLVPGTEVKVLRQGDPLVVALDDSRWAIASEEAAGIEVTPIEAPVRRKWWRRQTTR
jgi:Fe2+ transport system protein FeoA